MSLPVEAARLFPHHDGAEVVAAESFAVGRLLEDGDGRDVAWLLRTLGEARTAAWIAQRGHRQLSRRSRSLWRLVVGPPAATEQVSLATPTRDDLWPL